MVDVGRHEGFGGLLVPGEGLADVARGWVTRAEEWQRWSSTEWVRWDEVPAGVREAASAFDEASRRRAGVLASRADEVATALRLVGTELTGVDELVARSFRRGLQGWERLWRG